MDNTTGDVTVNVENNDDQQSISTIDSDETTLSQRFVWSGQLVFIWLFIVK